MHRKNDVRLTSGEIESMRASRPDTWTEEAWKRLALVEGLGRRFGELLLAGQTTPLAQQDIEQLRAMMGQPVTGYLPTWGTVLEYGIYLHGEGFTESRLGQTIARLAATAGE